MTHLTKELQAVKKAQKQLEAETDMNSKKAAQALEDLKQHLAAAQKDASDSKTALEQVGILCSAAAPSSSVHAGVHSCVRACACVLACGLTCHCTDRRPRQHTPTGVCNA